MKNFFQTALGSLIGAALVLGLIGGASVALADRVTTGGGTVSSIGVSSSGGSLTIGSSPVTTSGTITAAINLAHANAFSALQSFLNASSTLQSVTGTLYVGGNATSTINADGNGSIVTPSTGNLTVGGTAAVTGTLTVTGKTTLGNASTTAQDVQGIFAEGGTSTTTLTNGKIGIASSTPFYDLSLAAGKTAAAAENTLTGTSTTYAIDATKGSAQLYRTGTAATTFTATNFLPGASVKFIVCNPGASAGALTWSGFHTFGSAPSQTTTANQCDIYSVGMTAATSSPNGIMYYGQAGAGLQ